MTFKPSITSTRCLIGIAATSVSLSLSAQPYAQDINRFDGDHIRLRTNVTGFKESGAADTGKEMCAPVGSGLAVREELTSGDLVVRFYDIPDKPRRDVPQEALNACKTDDRVNIYTAYTIPKNKFIMFDFKRSGVTFGGLVIPFKFRLAGNKEVTSSSTIAPYVGFRSRYLQAFGLSIEPLLSAGLGLVPVRNPADNTTETKSALSVAAGLVMTSSKNEKFTAGLVVGRDFLSESDRLLDPSVDKAWLSFYLGIAM
jgi:hypothetical protein